MSTPSRRVFLGSIGAALLAAQPALGGILGRRCKPRRRLFGHRRCKPVYAKDTPDPICLPYVCAYELVTTINDADGNCLYKVFRAFHCLEDCTQEWVAYDGPCSIVDLPVAENCQDDCTCCEQAPPLVSYPDEGEGTARYIESDLCQTGLSDYGTAVVEASGWTETAHGAVRIPDGRVAKLYWYTKGGMELGMGFEVASATDPVDVEAESVDGSEVAYGVNKTDAMDTVRNYSILMKTLDARA